MLLFGHIGLTLSAALVGEYIYRRRHIAMPESGTTSTTLSPKRGYYDDHGLFDLRFWIIGSLLPDIIDKPAGLLFLSDVFHHNGRIFSHTLIFLLALLAAALYTGTKCKNWRLLALSMGVCLHLIFDSMWQSPETLFWPFHGWLFPSLSKVNWFVEWTHGFVQSPSTYIPEIIGFLITGWFVVQILRRRRVRDFLYHGYGVLQ